MKPLTADDFGSFFSELYGGRSPFPWQSRLASAALPGSWPKVIALPTASGKTACIDIAIFALACQAEWPAEDRCAPRRIFFVVDRRVIVDEAFQRAQHLARQLREAKTGILYNVAERLRLLAGGDEPLACFQLRGGIYRDDNWARTPIQPTVIASTVDQIGSRLLFRGYGLRGGSMRPVHAGLAANDSLIILDEAHCAVPFGETVAAIERYRHWAEKSVSRPFVFVTMTATPSKSARDDEILRDTSEDRNHPVLGPRLNATKSISLITAEKAKGDQALLALAEELAHQAVLSADSTGFKAICIIANRVATARSVYQLLASQPNCDAVLLTGRMRSLDRDHVVAEWLHKLSADSSGERNLDRRVYVVATQCLEVGANLDFDVMVSECASLDALRQRFGRLNRMGRGIAATGAIVIRADQVAPKFTDPIYGEALPMTWAWLNEVAHQSGTNPSYIDMGITGLNSVLQASLANDDELMGRLNAQSTSAPILLPAHLDCLAQTSPEPFLLPDEALFLHGPDRGAPDVQVIWRSDIDSKSTNVDDWVQTISLCPPTSSEHMSVPLHIFRRWMRDHATDEDLSDIVGGLTDDYDPEETKQTRTVMRWVGPEESDLVTAPEQIHPGDTLIIPSSLGGWDVFGHIPDPDNNIDLGDQAYQLSRGQYILRLHPGLVQMVADNTTYRRAIALAQNGVPENLSELRQALLDLAEEPAAPAWLAATAFGLARDKRLKVLLHPFGGLVLQGAQQRRDASSLDHFTGEDDTSSATVAVTLDDHLGGVSQFARSFAENSGLNKDLVADIALAGKLHDVGKADSRFQLLLHGGNRWKAAAATALLAKSERMPQSSAEANALREKSGFPKGIRHELLSVRLVESASELLAQANDPDLLLHLIACHHGHGRPFAPVIVDPEPIQVEINLYGAHMQTSSLTGLEMLDSGIAERYWRLTRRYGWWGLAYLETIIRLADHRESAEEQHRKEAQA